MLTPSLPNVGDSLKLDFVIKNIGLQPASSYTLNIYKDVNFDSLANPSELINSHPFIITLNQNDSVSYRYGIGNIDSGKKQYIGIVVYSQDEDTLNNKLVRGVTVGGQVISTGLLINEIMYAPQTPEPEWIELYNNSTSPINIKNWKLADESSIGTPVTITTNDRVINPNDYLVIAKSNAIVPPHPLIDTNKVLYLSNLPTLNNDGDRIVIFNNASGIIDDVTYRSSWGGSSRNSLERISFTKPSQDSTNWISSLDCEFSTPTRLNSFGSVVTGNRNDLVINEIMFDPLTTSCEWVELYNNSGKYINLNGWKATIGSSNVNLFNSCSFYLQPGAYLVLAADTTLYNRFGYLQGSTDSTRRVVLNSGVGLSNSGAMIKVSDVVNNTIDSLLYSPNWHNSNISDTKGYSLERINVSLPSTQPTNWSSSADPLGGTPGKKNSIFTSNNKETSLSISPNPFSPDGDGWEDFTIIKYKLKTNTAQVRVKIFDVKGRIVKTLLNNQFSGSESQMIFDGKDDSGEKLRIGIYVAFLEAIDDKGGTHGTNKSNFCSCSKVIMTMKNTRIIFYLIIVAVSFFVYYNSLNNDFVFDDESVVQNNISIQTLSNIPKFFTAEEGFHKVIGRYYRPVVSSLYATDFALWGLKPFGFHLTNVIIHVIASLLLLMILLKLFGDYKYGLLSALIGALIFAVHPVHTEAVSWISGRTDSLTTLFFFLAFLFYIKYSEEGNKKLFLIVSVIAYFLGLLSKEMIVTMPVLMFLYDYFFKRRDVEWFKKNALPYIVFISATVVFVLIRYLVLKDVVDRTTYMYFYGKDTQTAVFTMFKTIPVYFRLLVFPLNLLYHYNGVLPDANSIVDLRVLFSVVFILAMIGVSFFIQKKYGVVSFAILFFFVSLLPVMNFIPTMNFMAERFLYLSSFALSVLVSYVLIKFLNEKNKNLLITMFLLIVVVFGYLTYKRNFDWKNNDTLYATADGKDGSVLLVNAGNLYANKKNFDEAEKRYRRAIEIRDNSVLAHHNLGLIYLVRGDIDSAEIKFKKGLSIDSLAPDGYFQLANIYRQEGNLPEAITNLEKLQTIVPNYRDSKNILDMLKSGQPRQSGCNS